MADSAPAITAGLNFLGITIKTPNICEIKGQKAVWPAAFRCTCYFHLRKAVKEKLKKKPLLDFEEEIFSDISILQLVVFKFIYYDIFFIIFLSQQLSPNLIKHLLH